MELITHNSPHALLSACGHVLWSKKDIHNNLLHLIHLLGSNSDLLRPPFWYASIVKDGTTIGCCVHADPDGLVLSSLPRNAVEVVGRSMSKRNLIPTRLVGDPVVADRLVERLYSFTSIDATVSSDWNIYRLDSVASVQETTRGRLRPGSVGDVEIARAWGQAYGTERDVFINTEEFMTRKLASGELYIWDYNGARSIVTVSGTPQSGMRISSVYTPKQYRGRRYATAAILETCKLLLRKGADYVVLTANVGEPVERLYKKLGFYVVGTQRSYKVERK